MALPDARGLRHPRGASVVAPVIVYFHGKTGPVYDLMSASEKRAMRERATACAACEVELETDWEKAVDHSHASGRVRGVVCKSCNSRMRSAHEDRMRRIGLYLDNAERGGQEEPQEPEPPIEAEDLDHVAVMRTRPSWMPPDMRRSFGL